MPAQACSVAASWRWSSSVISWAYPASVPRGLGGYGGARAKRGGAGLAGVGGMVLGREMPGFAVTGEAYFGLLLAGGDSGGVGERSAGHHRGEHGPG